MGKLVFGMVQSLDGYVAGVEASAVAAFVFAIAWVRIPVTALISSK
jgi:hypothetical protein